MWIPLRGNLERTRRLVAAALLTALALALGYLERMIPLDATVPGVKLGLANLVVVTALYLFPFPMALGVALLKSGTTFLVSGSLVGFFYGLCGTLLSFFVMAALKKLLGREVSPVGISAAGGMLHVTGQLGAAILVTGTPALIGYLPLLLASGAVTGVLIGVTVRGLLPYSRQWALRGGAEDREEEDDG